MFSTVLSAVMVPLPNPQLLLSSIVVEPPPPALQASFKKYSVSTSGVVQGLSPGIVMVPTPANSPQLQYSRRMA